MKKDKTKDPLYSMMRLRCAESKHELAVEQEESAADLVGGKRHRGSGSSIYQKSDASSDVWQVECKGTVKLSLTLHLDWLEKIQLEAHAKKKLPMLHLRFDASTSATPADWVCIPLWVFSRMVFDE